MNWMRRLLVVCFLLIAPIMADAQCAMCRTQVVNNVSQGETTLASGLNAGILYLFFTPYVAIGVVAFLWFRNAKVNERKRIIPGNSRM